MLWKINLLFRLEMVTGRAARGPGRAWTSRPAGLTGLNGVKDFLCIVRGQLSTGGSKLICIEQLIVNRETE